MNTNKEYKTFRDNLINFRRNLTETSIKFIFFTGLTDKLLVPQIKTVFNSWNLNGNQYYISRGVSDNNIYVYRESDIKYLVNIINTKETDYGIIHNVEIIGIGEDNENNEDENANLGDHIDFGITRRKDGNIIVKTHKTIYVDIGNFVFERDELKCNFVYDKMKLDSFTNFSMNTKCQNIDYSYTRETIDSTYQNQNQDPNIIYTLCKVLEGTYINGGTSIDKKNYIMYGGKRYLIRKGKRNGKFIKTAKRRIYLQRGGNDYKGITFMSDSFIQFLSDTVFKPLYTIRNDLVEIRVIYDELNETGRDANKHIIILYDFIDYIRNIFYLNTEKTLIACYANNKIEDGKSDILESRELEIYNEYMSEMKQHKNISINLN
jgi:hypothetical protein